MKNLLITIFISVVFTFYTVNVSSTKTVTWAKTKRYGHERKTVLQFYFHDIRTGDSPTVALIAKALEPKGFISGFGDLFMVDDPLTISLDPNSMLVGRAQGFYGSASQESVSYVMGLTFGFLDGIYNRSSVVIFGQNPIMNRVREFPVVGGTGLFRMARGYAVARTYFHNSTAHNAIVGYNVTVFTLRT